MKLLCADTWVPVGNAFIRGEVVPNAAPIWQGHAWLDWESSQPFERSDRIRLSRLVPPCDGEAIITSITVASEVFKGEAGVWIDFHGVGPLTIGGELVEFVSEVQQDPNCDL